MNFESVESLVISKMKISAFLIEMLRTRLPGPLVEIVELFLMSKWDLPRFIMPDDLPIIRVRFWNGVWFESAWRIVLINNDLIELEAQFSTSVITTLCITRDQCISEEGRWMESKCESNAVGDPSYPPMPKLVRSSRRGIWEWELIDLGRNKM